MARRITPSQFNSMIRQAQQKQRQAVDNYNRAVRKARQAVDDYNREVRAHNQRVDHAIANYNAKVSAHNARVRADRQRRRNELVRLGRQAATPQYLTFRVSVETVQQSYTRLEQHAETTELDERFAPYLDLSEREAANSAGVMNALLGETPELSSAEPDAPESELTPVLNAISGDLGARWQGALYSLSPRNPDAARHFCTSAREIVALILDKKAPDADVATAIPNCERTPRGTPTRRAKIRFFLRRKGLDDSNLEDFVESDMENVVDLFQIFNDGTHGSAGKFTLVQLQAIRKRVEDGVLFLSQ
ncbi:MAG: hypothetical protein IT534_10080, partial [Bauldia sp.]|nr:hypothetical protein [Bauldia sp.]